MPACPATAWIPGASPCGLRIVRSPREGNPLCYLLALQPLLGAAQKNRNPNLEGQSLPTCRKTHFKLQNIQTVIRMQWKSCSISKTFGCPIPCLLLRNALREKYGTRWHSSLHVLKRKSNHSLGKLHMEQHSKKQVNPDHQGKDHGGGHIPATPLQPNQGKTESKGR